MSLATGTRLGPYEIVAPIGADGMGELTQPVISASTDAWLRSCGNHLDRRSLMGFEGIHVRQNRSIAIDASFKILLLNIG